MDRFRVHLRPYNIGSGWRHFRTVSADNISDACKIALDGEAVSESPFNQRQNGTPESPFICNGGASEIMAQLEE